MPLVQRAFKETRSGVPGPVFVECPVDLLYPEAVVRDWYGGKSAGGGSISGRLMNLYLRRHVNRLFAAARVDEPSGPVSIPPPVPGRGRLRRAGALLTRAERPVLLVGSQALLEAGNTAEIADAVARLRIPVFLSGMARGLLGPDHPCQIRHGRKRALREADLVILAGVPCDFRLDYGRQIRGRTLLISANRSRRDLRLNRRPDLALQCDAGVFLRQLAEETSSGPERWSDWRDLLRRWDVEREEEIDSRARQPVDGINPLLLCREIDAVAGEDAVLVVDGGDFVATASYIVKPRGPLSWLDPGAFGTLGVGAGFALGARLCRPQGEAWILYGDGSAGYSLAEFDTFVRHDIPVIAVVGNDACWSQIERGQVEMLHDDTGCRLNRTDYHRVAEGFGGRGFLLQRTERITETLQQARQAALSGSPALVNAHIGKTDFRKGSVSI
jgi:acetolactate synthase-1/2/3 large subunit